MSIAQLLSKAAEMGVTLRLDGETIKIGGPRAAREALRPDLAARKPEIIAYLRAASPDGSPSSSGASFWPWGPYLTAADVARRRAELVNMIEQLADMESWPRELLDDVLARAVRGPLSDLLPNVAYFRERLAGALTDVRARNETAARSWPLAGFNDRRME